MNSDDGVADVALYDHQLEVVNAAEEHVVLTGGWRAGKTYTAVWDALSMASEEPDPILVLEPTYKQIATTYVRLALSEYKRIGLRPRWEPSKLLLTVPVPGRSLEFIMRSAERPESYQGLTVSGLVADEWEACGEAAMIEAFARVTTGRRRKRMYGTAEGFGFGFRWTEEKPLDDLRVVVAGTSRNLSLPESYIRSMEKVLTPAQVAEKLHGQRTRPEDTVYPRFDRRAHASGAVSVPLGHGRIVVAADFNVGAMTWLICRVDRDTRCIHVLEEVIGSTAGVDTMQHGQHMRRRLAEVLTRERRRRVSESDVVAEKIEFVVDASGRNRTGVTRYSHVDVLHELGFTPRFHSHGNPAVEDRIASVNRMLYDRPVRLTVDPVGAPKTVRSLEYQGRVTEGAKRGEPDKSKGLDHAVDALGYLVEWHFPTHLYRPNDPGSLRRVLAQAG